MAHNVHVLLLFVFWLYVFLFVLAPILLKVRFRIKAKVEPMAIEAEELPAAARAYFDERVAEFAKWNFELVSYVTLGRVSPPVGAYMALLSNVHTSEWADTTFLISPVKQFGYFEFITRFSDKLQIDTNSSPAVPMFFSVPEHPTFRLPEVRDVFALYRVHRMLVNEIAHGALPVIPPAGEEVTELQRRLDRFGPWQQEHGYMFLEASGENFRLTWKGAILGAWRAIWPISVVRTWRQRAKNRAILSRLGAAA